jgi:chromosomal replication initiator protein
LTRKENPMSKDSNRDDPTESIRIYEIDSVVPERPLLEYLIPHRGKITLEIILYVVCRHFEISRQHLVSPYRKLGLVQARRIAIWLCKEMTTLSYPQIGQRIGRRDHTTIMHGYRHICAQIRSDDTLWHLLNELKEQVHALVAKRDSYGSKD